MSNHKKNIISRLHDIFDSSQMVLSPKNRGKNTKKKSDVNSRELKNYINDLNCLYGLSHLADQTFNSLEEILPDVIKLIPCTGQYPCINGGKIIFKNKEFKTNNFKKTEWKQSAKIKVLGKAVGGIELYYTKKIPKIYSNDFLRRRQGLIDAMAERLGKMAERKQLERNLMASYQNLEFRVRERTKKLTEQISGRKLAEEKIQSLNELNQKILDNVPLSIVMLDKKGRVTATNELAKNLMDSPDKRLLGNKITDTEEIKNNKELTGLYAALFAKGKSFHYENLPYFLSKKNEHRSLNIIAVPLLDKQKKVEGAISMALDNTEEAQAKRKLRHLNRELERKVNERTYKLNLINKKLSTILDLKSKFVSDASHELRTPLTVIQGNLDLAVREAEYDSKNMPEIYPLIINEVERMKVILSDLTMLTNVDVGHEQIIYEKISLNQLVAAAIESLDVLAKQKNIKLINKSSKKTIYIIGDDAKLEKMLLNIIRNGIKYTDPDGYVKIWLKKDETGVKITVMDNGIGIPEADLPHIFDRFYRVDKARSRKEGGSGLGLSIVKWIVEAHQGSIDAQSVVGKGSKFTVFLPHNNKENYKKNALFN